MSLGVAGFAAFAFVFLLVLVLVLRKFISVVNFVGDVGGEGAGGAGGSDLQAVRVCGSFGEYVGWVGRDVEAGGVVAGKLEAVEESGGAADFELAGGEGVDDDGERGLDGVAVFEGGELELGGPRVLGRAEGATEAGVPAMEAGVVEAEGLGSEGGRSALVPLVLMWRQRWNSISVLLGGTPPGGTLCVSSLDTAS